MSRSWSFTYCDNFGSYKIGQIIAWTLSTCVCMCLWLTGEQGTRWFNCNCVWLISLCPGNKGLLRMRKLARRNKEAAKDIIEFIYPNAQLHDDLKFEKGGKLTVIPCKTDCQICADDCWKFILWLPYEFFWSSCLGFQGHHTDCIFSRGFTRPSGAHKMPHSCRLRKIDESSKRRNAATHAPNIDELDDQMARACMLIARAPELKDAMRSECMIVKRYLLQGKALILKVCPTVKRTHMNLAELNGHIMPNCFCISRSDSNSGAKVTVCPCALHRCLFGHVPIKQFVFYWQALYTAAQSICTYHSWSHLPAANQMRIKVLLPAEQISFLYLGVGSRLSYLPNDSHLSAVFDGPLLTILGGLFVPLPKLVAPQKSVLLLQHVTGPSVRTRCLLC